ncbi:MAG: rhomboid family intramembrane serine protease [Alphaproteobacteria bacterium]
MGNKDDKDIIHFPNAKNRKDRDKNKKRDDKEDVKKQREQDNMEEYYRSQYRAQRAKDLSQSAQKSASSSKGMINWDKIPPFTRTIAALCLIVQIAMSFIITDIQKLYLIFHYGFTPGFYTGEIAWGWSALAAPFTTMIMHSDWMHLAFNLLMMVAMCGFFERIYGTKRTITFFILCGMAGNLTYFILSPGSHAPVIGASGALSGIFAVMIFTMIEHGMVRPEAQKRGPIPFIILWTVIIVAFGLLGQNISWQSHLGGFYGGIALFHLWKKNIIHI